MGECELGQLETKFNGFPEDAGCAIADKEIENYELERIKKQLENVEKE